MLLPLSPTLGRYSWVTSCLLTLQSTSHTENKHAALAERVRGSPNATIKLTSGRQTQQRSKRRDELVQRLRFICRGLLCFRRDMVALPRAEQSAWQDRWSGREAVWFFGGFSASSLLGRLLVRRGAPSSYRRNPHDSPALGYLFLASTANGELPVAKSARLVTVPPVLWSPERAFTFNVYLLTLSLRWARLRHRQCQRQQLPVFGDIPFTCIQRRRSAERLLSFSVKFPSPVRPLVRLYCL